MRSAVSASASCSRMERAGFAFVTGPLYPAATSAGNQSPSAQKRSPAYW